MPGRFTIDEGGLDHPQVKALLQHHLITARAAAAKGCAHALDLSGLKAHEIRFWSAWEDDTLLGIGALKRLDPVHGEVKSMHTAETARRRGVAGRILARIIAAAREQGLNRLSLETGSWPYFAPARELYARHGFIECAPFADYGVDPNSVFMTLALGGLE